MNSTCVQIPHKWHCTGQTTTSYTHWSLLLTKVYTANSLAPMKQWCALLCYITIHTEYKSNFERIGKLVLIGGPDDGIVEPWQSTWVVLLFFVCSCGFAMLLNVVYHSAHCLFPLFVQSVWLLWQEHENRGMCGSRGKLKTLCSWWQYHVVRASWLRQDILWYTVEPSNKGNYGGKDLVPWETSSVSWRPDNRLKY